MTKTEDQQLIHQYNRLPRNRKSTILQKLYEVAPTAPSSLTIDDVPRILRGSNPPRLFRKDKDVLRDRIRQQSQRHLRDQQLGLYVQDDIAQQNVTAQQQRQKKKSRLPAEGLGSLLQGQKPEYANDIYPVITTFLRIPQKGSVPRVSAKTWRATDVTDAIVNEHTQVIDFNHIKRIRHFPEFCQRLSTMKSLRVLKLRQNMSIDDCTHLAQALSHLKKLQILSLEHHYNQGEEPCVVKIAEALPNLENLCEFYLEGYKIKQRGHLALANGLRQLKNLRVLNLLGTGNGVRAIAEILPRFKELQTLILAGSESDTDFGIAGHTAIAQALPHLTKLVSLDLVLSGLQDCTMYATALPHLKHLRKLDLSWNPIGDAGCEALANIFPDLKHLKDLYLSSCDFGDEGCKKLAHALPNLNKLESLDLSENHHVGVEGMKALSDAWPRLKHLRKLHFRHCSIDDPKCSAIANNLGYLTQLIELDLGENDIGYKGCWDLANNVKHLKNLKTLSFDDNRIENDGFGLIVYALQEIPVLSITINVNEISPDRIGFWKAQFPNWTFR